MSSSSSSSSSSSPVALFNNSLRTEDLHFQIPSPEILEGLRTAEEAVAASLVVVGLGGGGERESKSKYATPMARLELLAAKVLERATEEPTLRALAVIYLALQGCTGSYFLPGLTIGMSTAFADPELARLHFAFLETGAHAQLIPLWKLVCERGPIFGEDTVPVDTTTTTTRERDPHECARFFDEQFARGMAFLETCKTRPSSLSDDED